MGLSTKSRKRAVSTNRVSTVGGEVCTVSVAEEALAGKGGPFSKDSQRFKNLDLHFPISKIASELLLFTQIIVWNQFPIVVWRTKANLFASSVATTNICGLPKSEINWLSKKRGEKGAQKCKSTFQSSKPLSTSMVSKNFSLWPTLSFAGGCYSMPLKESCSAFLTSFGLCRPTPHSIVCCRPQNILENWLPFAKSTYIRQTSVRYSGACRLNGVGRQPNLTQKSPPGGPNTLGSQPTIKQIANHSLRNTGLKDSVCHMWTDPMQSTWANVKIINN